jgi:hypothetical protein
MLRARLAVSIALLLGAALACGPRSKDEKTQGPNGPLTKMGTDSYVRKAIRSSNEGVILLPSTKAERVYELPRLNEIAHSLREPAAACFLFRAIETMQPSKDGTGFTKVPEGQVKIRTRIAPSGEVLSTEVLETGFADTHMPECVMRAINKQTFPQNKGGVAHYVDIVYWVSLGLQSDVHTEAYRTKLRREQVAAGVRGRPCLQGRAAPGHYKIEALNLVDRYGNTMVNRAHAPGLGDDVRACLETALGDLQLSPEPEAFVRPVVAQIEVDVDGEGAIAVKDEQWLHLLQLEERAKQQERRAAMGLAEDAPVDEGEPEAEPEPEREPETPKGPRRDPGTAGKIDLAPRRGGQTN